MRVLDTERLEKVWVRTAVGCSVNKSMHYMDSDGALAWVIKVQLKMRLTRTQLNSCT